MRKKFSRNQTSFYEQVVFYYVKKFFPDAENRFLVNDSIEVDIFIPSIKVAIEYDGCYWHKKRLEYDNNKNTYLNKSGIGVVRIRDTGLPELNPFLGVVYYHRNIKSNVESFHIDEIVEMLLKYLSEFSIDNEKKSDLKGFRLSHKQFLLDRPDILAVLNPCEVENSVADVYGTEDWDYEKNKSLLPNNIPADFNHRVFYKCQDNKSHLVYPANWNFLKEKPSVYKCHYFLFCTDTCEIKKNYLLDYLNGIVDLDVENHFLLQMLEVSNCTADCIEKRFDSKSDESLVERFDKLFITRKDKYISFLNGRHLYWPKYKRDLELIKKLLIEYSGLHLLFDPLSFDASDELREAYIGFYQWLLPYEKENLKYTSSAHTFLCEIFIYLRKKEVSIDFIQRHISFIEKNRDCFMDYLQEYYIEAFTKYIEEVKSEY